MKIDKTTSKWKAVKSFINTWLKDQRKYCGNCGATFFDTFDEEGNWIPCCEDSQVGSNYEHTAGVVKENQIIKKTRANDTGAGATGHMRLALAMPPSLLADLETYFEDHYKEKLFNDVKEMREFMKEFPMFTLCKKI